MIVSVIGQKIKLVIAACLWNNPQVRHWFREFIEFRDLTLCRSAFSTSLATFWTVKHWVDWQ